MEWQCKIIPFLYVMIWMALILTFSILIQTWHWYRIFQPPKQQKHLIFSHTPKIFISVIICFHRPWTSIPRVLKRLCEQTYPHFEVLLINDGPVKLQPSHLDWIQQQSKFKYIIHNKKRPGKKDALITGIRSSQHEWLALTDIDCIPGPHWLRSIVHHLPDHPGIILGYSPYLPSSGLLHFMIEQETLLTAIQYLGWARYGTPYMGVGRNLIYHRTVYEKTTFQSHLHLPSGDDDLFVNEAARTFPTYEMLTSESIVYSTPPETWRSWWRQKQRHLSIGKYYSLSSKVRISLFSVCLGIEKSFLLFLLITRHYKLFVFFICLKIILTLAPLRKTYHRMNRDNHFPKMWIYEWMHFFYLILASPWIFLKTKRKWD